MAGSCKVAPDNPALLRRMLETAVSYESSADRLAASILDYGPSQIVLKVLAFEIFLKALCRHHNSPAFGHDYLQMFQSLPNDVQERLLLDAGVRVCVDYHSTGIGVMLKDWRRVFEKHRYDYEQYEDLGSVEYYKITKAGANGDHIEGRTINFWPEELFGIMFAIKAFFKEVEIFVDDPD